MTFLMKNWLLRNHRLLTMKSKCCLTRNWLWPCIWFIICFLICKYQYKIILNYFSISIIFLIFFLCFKLVYTRNRFSVNFRFSKHFFRKYKDTDTLNLKWNCVNGLFCYFQQKSKQSKTLNFVMISNVIYC